MFSIIISKTVIGAISLAAEFSARMAVYFSTSFKSSTCWFGRSGRIVSSETETFIHCNMFTFFRLCYFESHDSIT